jgi:hypothetical protein
LGDGLGVLAAADERLSRLGASAMYLVLIRIPTVIIERTERVKRAGTILFIVIPINN